MRRGRVLPSRGQPADNPCSCALARVVWREVAKIIISDKVPAAADFDWLFPYGNIVETPGVLKRIPRKDRLAAVAEHAHGNWGEIDGVFWSENDSALRTGRNCVPSIGLLTGDKFLIITAGDRKRYHGHASRRILIHNEAGRFVARSFFGEKTCQAFLAISCGK